MHLLHTGTGEEGRSRESDSDGLPSVKEVDRLVVCKSAQCIYPSGLSGLGSGCRKPYAIRAMNGLQLNVLLDPLAWLRLGELVEFLAVKRLQIGLLQVAVSPLRPSRWHLLLTHC